ncbi:hypothetical protein [Nocardiopsis sp. Huas11]|uniref:hypothetical protein n=1 Tax=Nocardiopsis sp. Huas11 TaxID=2183912 RepID=UPI000EB4B301|nr:hypothetical protein [Nocardiopsis sp. Huas11]
MVATVTRALPRPAHHTAALVTSVVLLVILSFPVTSGPGESEAGPVPGPVSAPLEAATVEDASGDDTPRQSAEQRADLVAQAKVTVGPPTTTCDRGVLRDLPDAVPSCALRLTAWDQPWWPLPIPHPDPVPEQDHTGDLPPTRAPPPTANTLI